MPVTTEVPERANPKTTTVRGVSFECSIGNIPFAALMGFPIEINQSQTVTFQSSLPYLDWSTQA